VTLVDFDDPI